MGEGGGGAEATLCRQAPSGFSARPAFPAHPAVAAVQSSAGEDPTARGAQHSEKGKKPGGWSYSEANQSDPGGDTVGGKAFRGYL